MAISDEVPYQPVALVVQLSDGQFVVLHGLAEMVETADVDWGDYESTIRWTRGHSFTQLRMTDVPGVQVRSGGDLLQVQPLLDAPTDPE